MSLFRRYALRVVGVIATVVLAISVSVLWRVFHAPPQTQAEVLDRLERALSWLVEPLVVIVCLLILAAFIFTAVYQRRRRGRQES